MAKQVWHDLLFAHWPITESQIAHLIPKGLELELWEGQPWLSISPFRISGLRARWLPPIPYVSRFPELNVRTYVNFNGKPGIYFLSLEAANRIAVEAARALFHLPYLYAHISMKQQTDFIEYESKRLDNRGQQPAEFLGTYKATDATIFHAQPGTLIHLLTERYCMYSANESGDIFAGEIHHLPWDLQQAKLHLVVNSLVESHGIGLPPSPPLLTFTKRLDVLFWPTKKVGSS